MTNSLHTTAKPRLAALLMALVMVLGLFGGFAPATVGEGFGSGIVLADPTTSASPDSGKGVDSLWDQIDTTGDKVSVGGELNTAKDTNLDSLVEKGKSIAQTITGILTIIAFVALLFSIVKLALSAGNPQTRKMAITGILFSGISLTLFGGAWVVVSFFWNLLSTTAG